MKLIQWKSRIWILEVMLWLLVAFLAALLGVEMKKTAVKRIQAGKPCAASHRQEQRTSDAPRNQEPNLSAKKPTTLRQNRSTQNYEMAYGRLPLSFEANRGQADRTIKFLSRGSRHGILLTDKQAILQLPVAKVGETPAAKEISQGTVVSARSAFVLPARGSSLATKQHSVQWTTVRMVFQEARSDVRVEGEHQLARKSNYLSGNNPENWRTNIPNYSRVRYHGIYPGIDLVYYGNQQQLEYDLIVSPGADPRRITLRFETEAMGQQPALRIAQSGALIIRTPAGEIQQRRARVYQWIEGRQTPVPSQYVMKGEREIGFSLGVYNATRPLIIDPVLSYSVTGVGGSAIAVDSQGNAYVTGAASPDLMATPGAFQSAPGGGTCFNGPNTVPCSDILVAKLNPAGTDLVFATFLGGNGSDYSYGIAVDAAGNSYVTGATSSTNFPVTVGAYQVTPPACAAGTPCYSAFVTKLNADGTGLSYSTYLHGQAGGQGGNGIGVDSSGRAAITGDGETGGYVTRLSADGSAVVQSVIGIGGSAIALDAAGDAYVVGRQGTNSYVTKLDADSGAVIYSYRLGGTFPQYAASPEEVEALTGIAVDVQGNAYITGYTAYKDFPTTPGVVFPTAPGAGVCGSSICRDAFISKLNATGTELAYSTYLGGDSIDYATSIAADNEGNAYVTGSTRSINFPVTSGTPFRVSGGIFVAKLNPLGTEILYSNLLGGGSNDEGGTGIAIDQAGYAYVTGTAGAGFPFTPGAFHLAQGSSGGFVGKIFDDVTFFVPIVLSSTGQNGSFFTSELTITNRSSSAVSLEYRYTAAFGGGSGKGTDSLAAGKQWVIPDAISYLKTRDIPIPDSGNRGGTLAVRFRGLSSPSEGGVTVRTTTAVTNGRAGLAYAAVARGIDDPVYLCGLRQNANDRSNVAIQNVGTSLQGDITLRVSLFAGGPESDTPEAVYEETLRSGEFKQFSGILQLGEKVLSSGYARIERIRGVAPYYAYAVINDQISSDGSFVGPVAENQLAGRTGLILPVIVETETFHSELVLANWSGAVKTLFVEFVADGSSTPASTVGVTVVLRAHEQLILPDFVQWMRERGVSGLLPGQSYVGPLFISVQYSDLAGVFVGARTSSTGRGGRYGVFYSAVPTGATGTAVSWLYDMQQTSSSRTNLGLVNTGEIDSGPDTFKIEIFDGETGTLVTTVDGLIVEARRLVQTGSVLAKYAPNVHQAYARITRVSGENPFIAYSVINDGGQPGQGSGDGAFIASVP